jgi:hypothetical protein
MLPAWSRTLQLPIVEKPLKADADVSDTEKVRFHPAPEVHGEVGIKISRPAERKSRRVLITVVSTESGDAAGEGLDFRPEGWTTVRLEQFAGTPHQDQFTNFFTVYNRTMLQERVRDIIATIQYARQELRAEQVLLHGHGRAGLWTLLAAPKADGVIADCNQLDTSNDETFLAPDLFCPGLLKIGGLQGAAILAAPHPLYLYNTGTKFATEEVKTTYESTGNGQAYEQLSRSTTANELALWVKNL